MSENVSDFWNKQRVEAAQLLAEGLLTDAEIAARCKITERQLNRWKQHPVFAARVKEIVDGAARVLNKQGIRDKEQRLVVLQKLFSKHVKLVSARGKEMAATQEIAGGETGLLVRDYRGRNADRAVYKYDAALIREMRGILDDIAKEKGERQTKIEHGGGVLNIDLSELTLEQLDKFEQYIIAGHSQQRAFAMARQGGERA